MNTQISRLTCIVILLSLFCLLPTGCSQDEEVIDVDTPIGDVEVNKDGTTGNTEVEVDADE